MDPLISGAFALSDIGGRLPGWTIFVACGLIGVGLMVLFVALFWSLQPKEMSAEERVALYTTHGGAPGATGTAVSKEEALAGVKDAAAQMLQRNQGLEVKIAKRLEGAGSSLKPAEWLLVHAGVFIAFGVAGLILGDGNMILGIIFLILGAVLPWMYLGYKSKKRLKAFNSQLPDTLQLMSGSLSAGLSLAQAVDTIVREGSEPVSGEFKRVLIETRLGVSLEDALEGITRRFDSEDFEWVVMAIKIQRQVGGNLAELLNTVAGTMREREYMRRQVAALAAEGKMSAWVLGGLPPAFLLFLLLTNRDYVMPLFTSPMGWAILGGSCLLLGVGVFWMSRMVKVEV